MTRLALTAGCLGLAIFATTSIGNAADRQRQSRWHIAGRQPSVRSTPRSHGTSHSRRQYSRGSSSQYCYCYCSGYGYGYGYGYGGYNRSTYVLPAQTYVYVPGRGLVPVQVNYGYGYGYGF